MSDSDTDTPDNPGPEPGGPEAEEDAITGELVDEVKESFLEYALSVIISRALPDARDGLKPVHRRILWSMSQSGLTPDRGHVKCATVVGDVIAKYHPHGDTAVYDALVRMAQDFSLRYTLVDPHGNFGSPADRPAAYRYTECRLERLASEMLAGIGEDTVDFNANFDGRHSEPVVLPSRFPNLLVNGSQGIAVGMATNIPPHNLGEVIDASIELLRNPAVTDEALLSHVKGPDFPTAGLILGSAGIRSAYLTGRGSVILRARTEIEGADDNQRIVVTEMPYQVSVESVGMKVHQMLGDKENKELADIREIRNESAKGNTRLVFDLKRGANAEVILNNLFKSTRLQVSFPINMVALNNNVPRTMTLRDLLEVYRDHQIEVVTRRSRFRLQKAEERAHILEGLLKAGDMLDEVIATIRSSENRAEARESLTAEPFEFSEAQADHILDLTLARLTRLARQEFEDEYEAKQAEISELTEILNDEQRLKQVIIEELSDIKDKFADARKTELAEYHGDIDLEDLIDDVPVVFVLSANDYGKCVLASEFRPQGRGGKGIRLANLNEGDYVKKTIHTTAHAYLLFFTNYGRMFRAKAYSFPEQRRGSKGTPLVNFFELQDGERIADVIDTRDYETSPYLLFVSKRGLVKKSLFTQYDSKFKGLRALELADGDQLAQVLPARGDAHLILVTKHGRAIKFPLEEVRQSGRVARGVRGIRLRGDDEVMSGVVAPMPDADAVEPDPDGYLLIVSDKGYAKRTRFDDFRTTHRGGQGVICYPVQREEATVVGALPAPAGAAVLLVSQEGKILQAPVDGVSTQGRTARGVIAMRVEGENRVTEIALVDSADVGDDDDDNEIDADAVNTDEAETETDEAQAAVEAAVAEPAETDPAEPEDS